MKRFITLILVPILALPAWGQSFTCNFGGSPACLDFGETVCSSRGKCVDKNAACFDSYQCNYEGFTCRSNVTECINDYENLQSRFNDLVSEYNELLEQAKRLQADAEDAESCVSWASTIEEAQSCY